MRYAPDEQGRYPLSAREYLCLCNVIGALHALITNKEELKERLELTGTGWEDLQSVIETGNRIYDKLLETIPIKKLIAIRREMRYMVCETRLNQAAKREDADDVFISNNALRHIINRAICIDCTFCEASRENCKKCQLYKEISDCFPYELGKPEGEHCPLSGATVI